MSSTGRSKAVLGLSGGVDSALTAKLAVEALGKENVIALSMPNEGLTNPENIEHAKSWAETLGIEFHIVPINPFLTPYLDLAWEASPLAVMNINARARANILYHYANTHDCLVLGTGNKTELKLGYFTKYGDGACDVEVIGSFYKTEVWEAAKALDLPKEIIEKTPSAELHPGQTDEEEMGFSYDEVDSILMTLERGEYPTGPKVDKVRQMMDSNRHKSEVPPTL